MKKNNNFFRCIVYYIMCTIGFENKAMFDKYEVNGTIKRLRIDKDILFIDNNIQIIKLLSFIPKFKTLS